MPSIAGTPVSWCCWIVFACCCRGRQEGHFSVLCARTSRVSPSSLSWALFLCVAVRLLLVRLALSSFGGSSSCPAPISRSFRHSTKWLISALLRFFLTWIFGLVDHRDDYLPFQCVVPGPSFCVQARSAELIATPHICNGFALDFPSG